MIGIHRLGRHVPFISIDRLTQSEDPVTSIGLDLGFASQASFTRFFSNNIGIAPTDYRRVSVVA